mgnify:FL=1
MSADDVDAADANEQKIPIAVVEAIDRAVNGDTMSKEDVSGALKF